MYRHYFKRIIDFCFILIAIIVLIPFLVPICILLLLSGEHKIFYIQIRVGYKNNFFKMWKFATMLNGSSDIRTDILVSGDDSRLTPVGKFLEKTKINEFPQVINVLKGNMSIVGARPLIETDFLKFSEPAKSMVYNTNPGITGIGSIIFRNEKRLLSETKMGMNNFYEEYIMPYKGELELWYQKNLSFWTDIKLIICTVWVLIFTHSELPYKIFKGLPPKPKELEVLY